MTELGVRQMNEIHVEAGYKLNGSLLKENLVDELVVYLAPSVLGDSARGMFHLASLDDLAMRRRLELHDVRMVGPDVRIIARVVH